MRIQGDQQPVTIDFETEAIEARPSYPPVPVGVSIKYYGKPARYYAFGHPTANNCTHKDACVALADAWAHPGGILCHNAKFDVDVAETHMGMPRLPWDKMHDTMFMLFLADPHAPSHALKPSAERLLGMAPDEQQAVKDWLVANGKVSRSSKYWGAFIACAPGDLVGSYADGDVIRTEKLYRVLQPMLKRRKMLDAYDRERKLMPILLDMERRGVDVDLPKLTEDVGTYQYDLAQCTLWIQRRLKAKLLRIDSDDELVAALIKARKVDLKLLGKTPTGAWKTDKASLAAAVTDKVLVSMLNHRASLATCVGTFMAPWLATAQASGGKIFTTWNQLKQYGGKGVVGAVTGRMSSTPNFQNIPRNFPPMWQHEDASLPKCPLQLSPLPLVRSYIIAPPGHVLIGRDYNQQELRILAHYEDGALKQSYMEQPWMDAHQTATTAVNQQLGSNFSRSVVKSINFGLIYGMGINLMAAKANCAPEEAKAAKAAVLAIYPGLRELQGGLKALAGAQEPLRTWGGREYHVEPAKLIGGELRTFEYKMLNVLVQGSAADCTKEAMIVYHRFKQPRHHCVIQVHDELLCVVPEQEVDTAMMILQECMESIEFDVPMLSDGKISTTNWAEMHTYDKKGERVAA